MKIVEPKILYFGTPVALVSSLNEDGSTNLSPISSFWALGWTMTLGVLDDAKLAENLRLRPECVINLPAPSMWKMVEKLAPLTAKDPVPSLKAKQFKTENDKFAAAGLTRVNSNLVRPARAAECPVQMEAQVLSTHDMGGKKLAELGGGIAAVVEIVRVHAADHLVDPDNGYIDSHSWSPLIYNFRHYYKLADDELGKTFRA